MTIDLYRLDGIEDYDEAIEALEDYVEDLVEEFLEAPEGEAYLDAYPEMAEWVGNWIYQLLCFGYEYGAKMLPHFNKTDVETILTQLFPRKLSLVDPEEANTTIPELIAFWNFLKRQYKHPNASKILTFLQKIQPQFKGIMNDPQNFGIAKSFFSAGTAAGFDMRTEAGLQAFQQQYNQSIQSANAAGISPPAEFQQLFGAITGAIPFETIVGSAESELAESELTESELAESEPDVRSELLDELPLDEPPPLSEASITLLQQQRISDTEPGPILKDFQMLLDAIGEKGVPVSNSNHLLSQSLLTELNQRLDQPIQLDLKRPVQKSFAPLNGLYLLLRTTGLGQITAKGKKHILVLNPDILQSWQQLNPTERYFTLLETWLIRANEEVLGERRTPMNEGMKCSQFWTWVSDKGKKFNSYAEQQSLSYYPALHNLALLQQFGLLEVVSGKPEAGKGWRVKQVKRLPLGDALMQVVIHAYITQDMMWESEVNPFVPFGQLQPALQPYFSDWQNNLTMPLPQFRSAVHIFKVSLGDIWRRLAISAEQTLYDLSRLILASVEFDSDHLDMFIYKNLIGRTVEITHPGADGDLLTDEFRIGELTLSEGSTMTYIFDFGDWWEFQVQLEQVHEDERAGYAEILDSAGDAPPQYPNWDGEEEELDEDKEMGG